MPTSSETSTSYKLCQLETLDQGIVETVFVSSSMAAVDQFFAQVEPLIARSEANAPLFLLVNITKAPTLPIIYLVQQARAAALRNPGKMFVRCAVITKAENKLLLIEIEHLMRSLQLDKQFILFFSENQREKALNWLLPQ
jgi:hypothetical protein